MAHHDIDADIPASAQHFVRLGYYTWLATATGYLWNWFIITLMCICSRPPFPSLPNSSTVSASRPQLVLASHFTGVRLAAVSRRRRFVSGSGTGFTDWFFASLFLVAGVPLSFIFW
jgi:hypothetical protein